MVRKTLSITTEMELFLRKNPNLSPSKMLQSKIIEIQEAQRLNFYDIKSLERQRDFLQKKLWDANEEIAELKEKLKNAKFISQKTQ